MGETRVGAQADGFSSSLPRWAPPIGKRNEGQKRDTRLQQHRPANTELDQPRQSTAPPKTGIEYIDTRLSPISALHS
ncbi:MAG: hypothetical protein AMJ93_15520 [Anaerolineae bacterium SM23_84]|nr:MAG: hypothetical protein AMJ93_15520 [Anaerolineae bacterium SM23_84]